MSPSTHLPLLTSPLRSAPICFTPNHLCHLKTRKVWSSKHFISTSTSTSTESFPSASAGIVACQTSYKTSISFSSEKVLSHLSTRNALSKIPRCTGSSSPQSTQEDSKASEDQDKVPFGNSRKDVLLIGVGVTVLGVALKSGLEFVGVDPLQAGNVVQLVLVLGLTIGWISTYIFRVSNKEMTYAQQLRDYENKVMQKRLEGLTEAELEALLEQVEEEKQRIASGEQI